MNISIKEWSPDSRENHGLVSNSEDQNNIVY